MKQEEKKVQEMEEQKKEELSAQKDSEEMNDEELDAVAGGGIMTNICRNQIF
jgi:hypothetical protein